VIVGGATVAASVLAVAFGALLLWTLKSRQSLAARVRAAEEAADDAAERADHSASAAERLAQALDALHQGVVLCDPEGQVVYRNLPAESFSGARHAEALAEQAISDVLKAAAQDGEPHTRSVDLYGPPRRNLQISAVPLSDGKGSVGGVAVIEDVSDRKRLKLCVAISSPT
jgi:PAS domain-containing protein